MKLFPFASLTALLLVSLTTAQAQITTITSWTFEGYTPLIGFNPSPAPAIGSGTATAIGMDNTYGTPGSCTNGSDVLVGAGGSDPAGTNAWRIRGVKNTATAANGWSSLAPIGTQGAQFAVSTIGYANISVSVDVATTAQGEGNMGFYYTLDGITWNVATIISVGGTNGTTIQNNNSSANTLTGTYARLSSTGSGWNNQITASFPGAGSNANFAIRIANASTGADCIGSSGAALNNSSGNWRFDNIIVSGTVGGGSLNTPPLITNSATATVDGPFTNRFADDAAWRAGITSIKINNVTLTNTAYAVSAGKIVYTPSNSVLLQTSGSKNIVITSMGYNNDSVVQFIGAGVAKQLFFTAQPAAPVANGGTLVVNPVLNVVDQYGNLSISNSATYTATPNGAWSFGPGSGSAQPLTNGSVVFTNLSATSAAAVNGATITFTASGAVGLGGLVSTTTNSAAFNIPAPTVGGFTRGNLAVFQLDRKQNNSTFSFLELNPTNANQSSPVNIFAVPATGTNALRNSSAGSTGRLTTSDDGTLLTFTGFADGSSATADQTTINPRGVGTFDAAGNFALATTYVGVGGSTANQTRSATTIDNTNFFIGDKGGVYRNDDVAPWISTGANVRSVKSYGGTVYAMQQYSSSLLATALQIFQVSGGAEVLYPVAGFPFATNIVDFCMIQSGNNGATYDTVYYVDGAFIYKYFYNPNDPDPIDNNGFPKFHLSGNWNTTNSGDGICAAKNSGGGFDIYYTTATSVTALHDSADYMSPPNVTDIKILYTNPAVSMLKGIAFAPVAAGTAPTVTTLTASNLTASAATLAASVNPNGAATTYWFNYGTTAAYGSVTGTNNLAAGASPSVVTGALTGLLQGTTYHYQIVAANPTGTSAGADATFTALSVTPPNLSGVTIGSGAFTINFTNATGASFSVLATNNLTAPKATWPVVGQAIESPAGSGNYRFTNSTPNSAALFYLLRQP